MSADLPLDVFSSAWLLCDKGNDQIANEEGHVMKTMRLTTTGIARILARGIKSHFNPERQQAEIERLVNLLQDLAMSRALESADIHTRNEHRRAESDAAILERLASELAATIG
jgi:hypothetical protein